MADTFQPTPRRLGFDLDIAGMDGFLLGFAQGGGFSGEKIPTEYQLFTDFLSRQSFMSVYPRKVLA
jgi:hypothetical protein